jgi:hypothetical protein
MRVIHFTYVPNLAVFSAQTVGTYLDIRRERFVSSPHFLMLKILLSFRLNIFTKF